MLKYTYLYVDAHTKKHTYSHKLIGLFKEMSIIHTQKINFLKKDLKHTTMNGMYECD